RPLFLWLHLSDLLRDGSPAAQRAVLDKALARLLGSVPEHSLLVFAAPWARPAPGREAPPLADASVHVPLVVCGAGLPATHSELPTAVQALPALPLRGELPERDGVFLMLPPSQTPAGESGQPGREAARWGLRSPTRKTLLADGGAPPAAPVGWSYD